MRKKLHMLAILLLVVGGINWAVVALTGGDLVTALFGKRTLMTNAIFIAVGAAALSIAFFRDSYLPFLGPSVIPCSLLKEQIPEGANAEVRVFVRPEAKVLYWAAEPANEALKTIPDWRQAYLGFKNAGVAVADEQGYVTLKVRKPQPYTVPMKGELAAHVHYRECKNNGFIDRVETVRLDGEKEGFDSPAPSEDVHGPDYVAGDAAAEREIEAVVHETGQRALMAQSGAIDESPQPAGAPLDAAFA